MEGLSQTNLISSQQYRQQLEKRLLALSATYARQGKRSVVQFLVQMVYGVVQHFPVPEQPIRLLLRILNHVDPLTKTHCERVARYAVLIGKQASLGRKDLATLKNAALMHDIGKIGVQPEILQYPGLYDARQRQWMNGHVVYTQNILDSLSTPGQSGDNLFQPVSQVAAAHHEAVDGSGYPHRLKADEIPLLSRIVAVADHFDAITSQRPYHKREATFLTAIRKLQAQAGFNLDAQVLSWFLKIPLRQLAHVLATDKRPDVTPQQIKQLVSRINAKTTGARYLSPFQYRPKTTRFFDALWQTAPLEPCAARP
jgi:HD-GYP domain-containing protein (c-di-GMP phosphodiesterase class II)